MPSHPRRRGKQIQHATCQIMRRMLVSHRTFNMRTGETSGVLSEEWVTRPCGTPLFNDEERRTGECSACASGWTDPHNYRV